MDGKSQSLFDLTSDSIEINEILNNLELTGDEQNEMLDRFFDLAVDNHDALIKKVDNYCWLIADLRGKSKVRREKGEAVLALAKRDAQNADRLEDRLEQAMIRLGKRLLETEHHELKFVGHGGKRPVTYVFEDISKLPKKYLKKELVLDKDKVREDLEAGKELPFARLEERGESLKIR